MVLKCKCKHDQQDKIYGQGMRVFNKTLKGSKTTKDNYRCTVCNSERSE